MRLIFEEVFFTNLVLTISNNSLLLLKFYIGAIMNKKNLLTFFLILTSLFATSVQASVIVLGTRFVFPAEEREISIRLENTNTTPALMQVWFDDGNEKSRGENVPFNVLPPLFKMKAKSSQSLRVIKTQANLPKDRETLFYINVLEIPPKPNLKKGESQNYLQFSIRSRFKFFYRPKLKISRNYAEKNIEWRLVQKGKSVVLEANNKSPYFITLNKLYFDVKGKKYFVKNLPMLEPFKQASLQLDKFNLPASTKGKINFSSINDFGGETEFSSQNL